MSFRSSKLCAFGQRALLLVLAPLMMALTCEGEPDLEELEDYAAAPLIQESVIPVEFEIEGVGWVPMLVPQTSLERLARSMCWKRRSLPDWGGHEDDKLCPAELVGRALGESEFEKGEFDPARLEGARLAECTVELCAARNQVCAAMWLDEIARSPLPQEIDFNGSFDLVEFVPEVVRETALQAAGADPNTVVAAKVRFQPLQAPGRAAALRGALNCYRQAAVASHAMQDPWVIDPQQPGSDTCLQQFDAAPETPFADYGNPDAELAMNDVYYLTFLDAANNYVKTLERTVASMTDSAQSQVAGRHDPVKEAATRWNGKVDSSLAIAKLIGWGESDAPGGQQLMSGEISCAGKLPANTVGPNGLPVCPPTSNDEGVQKARDFLSKFNLKIEDFTSTGIQAEIEKLADAYNAQTDSNVTGAQLLKEYGFTVEDLITAGYQQCKQAELMLLPFSEKEVLAGGVQTYFGTAPPSSQIILGTSALAAHFTGTASEGKTGKLGGVTALNYAKAGAVRTIDLIKTTADALSTASESAGVKAELQQGVGEVGVIAEGLVGKHRLEFHVGTNAGPGLVEKLQITIHGVVGASGVPVEQFYYVQGVKGLLCATQGSINGAPCNVQDWLMDLNAIASFSSSPDPRMVDLDGGYLTAEIETIKREVCSGMPEVCEPSEDVIAQGEAVYIIRTENGKLIPYGGIVPTVATLVLPVPFPEELTWPSFEVTRQVIAPVGGTLEQVLANAITPNSGDCSKVQETCAGVPADIWPPLESEIVGDGTASGQNAEQSWRYWLSLAKQAAAEADLRGQELLEHGLRMDLEIEANQGEIDVLCGGTLEGCGYGADGQPEQNQYATLGDRAACLWSIKGVQCERGTNGIPESVHCPMPLEDSATEATEAACHEALSAVLTPGQMSDIGYTLINTRLGLTRSSAPVPVAGGCSPFTALRRHADEDLLGGNAKETSRSEFIRNNIMLEFGQGFVTEIAGALSYEEEFADHYVLRYQDGAVIFDTRRPSPVADASKAIAPCNPSEVDLDTGSDYWSRRHPDPGQPARSLKCFAAQAEPPTIISDSDITHDTEHAALRHRWAWGFGHLRRAIATLGVITGKMDGTMKLATVYSAAALRDVFNEKWVLANPLSGLPCSEYDPNSAESPWLWHCSPEKKDDLRPIARCVPVKGVGGVGSDQNRQYVGRPVNQNGFITPTLGYQDIFDKYQMWKGPESALYTTDKWPILCTDTICSYGGGDPQMPYCALPDPGAMPPPGELALMAPSAVWSIVENADVGIVFGMASSLFAESTGHVGASVIQPAAVRAYDNNPAWQAAVDDMWRDPGGDFCSSATSDSILGAVWRALCFAPDENGEVRDPNNPATHADADFMQFGRLANSGALRVDDASVRKWLSPVPDTRLGWHGQMLFDLRKGSARAGTAPFQYSLTDRNIFDALELACHASRRAEAVLPAKCGDVETTGLEPEVVMGKVANALECLADSVSKAADGFAVQATPTLLESIEQFEAISPSSGLGGEYLAGVGAQYSALKRIGADFGKIGDANVQLAIAVRQLRSIDLQEANSDKAANASKMATMLNGVAAAASAMGGASIQGAGAAMASAAASIQASMYAVKAIQYQNLAVGESYNQQQLDIVARMMKELAAARDAADDIVLALNDLNKATNDLAIIQKKASKAWAGINFADYADGEQKDPQYVNVVMRRMFNTKMVRYEEALARAKKLAYLARRAVELRFGVDLQRLSTDMILVKAPSTWANDVCNLQGINYAAIRQPNPEQPVQEWTFGSSPLPGDHFANAFIGDYVQKLEDFVASYPIDFPLKDGDDIAVMSMADDIFRVTAACGTSGPNLLYYSTDFGKSEPAEGSEDTRGWFVDGCGYTLPEPDGGAGTPWTGCVAVSSDVLEPETLPDGGTPYGITRDMYEPQGEQIPAAAVPHRIQNQPCIPTQAPDAGEPAECPQESSYVARGVVAQWLHGLAPGHHQASIYALADPQADYDAGNQAELRIVRGDGQLIKSLLLAVESTGWKRFPIAFQADGTSSYRIEIRPSIEEQALPLAGDGGTPQWPGLYVTAAQVERVGQQADGTPNPPNVWVRTDSSRDIIDPTCDKLRGPAFRKRFRRECDYVCADGIKDTCTIADSKTAIPVRCYYETDFAISLEEIESGNLIPSGQIAIGNFNLRHNLAGINAVGTGLASCDGKPSSCYYNGFLEYTLIHSGNTYVRSYTGWNMPAKLDRAFVEHGKLLATERVITNPPSSTDLGLLEPYMKGEFKGRPIHGLYTLRIWEKPGLRWEQLEDLQLIWKYRYWTRFQK